MSLARRSAAAVVAHPRHVVLFALVAGLALGAWIPLVCLVLAAVLVVVLARAGLRTAVVVAAGLALAAGSGVADARRAAVDHGSLPAAAGSEIRTDVVLLEPARRRASGELVARVRFVSGPGRGEVVLLKLREYGTPPEAGQGAAAVLLGAANGRVLSVSGRIGRSPTSTSISAVAAPSPR